MPTEFYQPNKSAPKYDNNFENKPSDRLFINDNSAPEQPMFPVIAASSHPILSLIHIILKGGTVALYILVPLITQQFIWKQLVIVLAAVDFWIVKNITGRLMVGLRWWVDFDEQGEQKWKFQCKVDENNISKADDKIFWWTLALFALIWILLTVINFLRIDLTNIMVCVFCTAMILFNLYSYYKCSKIQDENLKKLARQYGAQAVGQFMRGSIIANYI